VKATIKQLAQLVGGEIIGDENLVITGVAGIDEAGEGDITFIANPKYTPKLKTTKASAVYVSLAETSQDKTLIRTRNPYLAFAKTVDLFHPQPEVPRKIFETCYISPSAQIGQDVCIYPFVYIGNNTKIGDRVVIYPGVFIGDNVEIGEDSVIHSNVSIREGSILGKRVILHCGVVIGSDGFGFAPDGKIKYKIRQVGYVQIDDDVEIGANTTVDRAAMGKTWIKRGTKIDNLVQVGHNAVIGEDCVISALVGIAGTARIGNNVTVAGQAGISGHIEVGDNVVVYGRAGVVKNVEANQKVAGAPAFSHRDWLRSQLIIQTLPDRLQQLERRVAEMEKITRNP